MNTNICPTCKTSIPAHAPGGFCPACILRDADELPPIGRTAPSVEEVRAAFPQLEVLELIGQGGMGFVYKARQPSLDRTVALKILSPELSRDPAFSERFAREARVLGKLNHPNTVTVFEHGESGGFFYLIMEHVDGVNLRQAMRAGRFTPQQALAVVPGICDALQAAHAQGIWHRDIKPENILLDAQGGVKIVDFGIARLVGDPRRDFTLTMTGAALGSVAYMAPEQHESPHDVDHRADIYSLGVVIYEMLTGELPLGRFPAPSARAAVDARIDEIVFRTLEKEREMRQQSADEVKTEVTNAAAGCVGSSATAPLHAGTLWVLGLTIGGACVAGVGTYVFTLGEGDNVRHANSLMTVGAMFGALGGLAFVLGVIGLIWLLYSTRGHGQSSDTGRSNAGTALLSLATILIGTVAWVAVAHAINHPRDGVALPLGIVTVPIAAFIIYRLWRGHTGTGSVRQRSMSGNGPLESAANPEFLAARPQLLLASKAALVGGIVLFIAAAVFTTGSTHGAMLAIAVSAFVLGVAGLLFSASAASVPKSSAAPIAVRSLWLFLAGMTAFIAGTVLNANAPWVPVELTKLRMKPVLVLDPNELKLGNFLMAVGAVSAIAGWCGILHTLSQMKLGAISTKLRAFARTCAWLPIAFLVVSTLLWTRRREGARPTQSEDVQRAAEQQHAAWQMRQEAETAHAHLKTKFPDLSSPEGAVVAYQNALISGDITGLLAAMPSSVSGSVVNPVEYAKELIAKDRTGRVVEDNIHILTSATILEPPPTVGVMDILFRKRTLGREPGPTKVVRYEVRIVGKNPGVQTSTHVCVGEGSDWRVIPTIEPKRKPEVAHKVGVFPGDRLVLDGKAVGIDELTAFLKQWVEKDELEGIGVHIEKGSDAAFARKVHKRLMDSGVHFDAEAMRAFNETPVVGGQSIPLPIAAEVPSSSSAPAPPQLGSWKPVNPIPEQTESPEPVELIYKMNELANAKNAAGLRKYLPAKNRPNPQGIQSLQPPSDEDVSKHMRGFAGKIVGVWDGLPSRPLEGRNARVRPPLAAELSPSSPDFALAGGPTAVLVVGPEKQYGVELERANGSREYVAVVFEWRKTGRAFSRMELLPYVAKTRVEFRPAQGDPKAILSDLASEEQVTQVFANGEAVTGQFDIRSPYTRSPDVAVKSANELIERITADLRKVGSEAAFKIISPATPPEKPAFFSYSSISPVVRKPALPKNDAGQPETPKLEAPLDKAQSALPSLKISILPEDRIELDGTPISLDDLEKRLKPFAASEQRGQVSLSIKKDASLEYVVRVDEMMRHSGVKFESDYMDKLLKAATYFISGQVNKPARRFLPVEPVTVSMAVTIAGGPTQLAALDKVQLLRTDASGATKTITVDVKKALAGKVPPEEDPVVMAGDKINVPESHH